MQSVKFKNREIEMAGNLYRPPNFDERTRYPTIVLVHPGGGVKEQVVGLYAAHLAEHGLIALTFDSSYQGESGGSPHFLDMPMNRFDDVYSAVDYVTTLPYADKERIGVAGICAGAGYAVKASAIDHRVKAVATVRAVNTGGVGWKGWDGKGWGAGVLGVVGGGAEE